jgi:hypothetical protein
MAGAVVGLLPNSVAMALATFVCTAVSNPAASMMSSLPLPPEFSKVDQSPTAGSALNVIVPLPLGPTEIAALATPVMPTIRKARTEAIFFMARNRKENTGWRKTLLLRADPGMKRELQFVHP